MENTTGADCGALHTVKYNTGARYKHIVVDSNHLLGLHRTARCEWYGLNIKDPRKGYRYLVGHPPGKYPIHARTACRRGSHIDHGPSDVPHQGGSIRTDKQTKKREHKGKVEVKGQGECESTHVLRRPSWVPLLKVDRHGTVHDRSVLLNHANGGFILVYL